MSVTLREITTENWRPVVRLKVNPEQEKFVAPNVYSIAQSKIEPFWKTMAIYDEETLVGFTMYGNGDEDVEDDEFYGYWICRLMIDHQHQGKGFGRAAMNEILKYIKDTGYSGDIYISFEPENSVAEKLYSSLGFEDTGKIDGGEKIFCIYSKK